MNKESFRKQWLDQATKCSESHAEFTQKWRNLALSGALASLGFAIFGLGSALIGQYIVSLIEVPIVLYFVRESRKHERIQKQCSERWLQMRQYRLEMADQFR